MKIMTSKSIDAERKSLFAQTLIIHVILTNKIPFIQSRANWPLFLTSLITVAVGAWLTVSPPANMLGFVLPPPRYPEPTSLAGMYAGRARLGLEEGWIMKPRGALFGPQPSSTGLLRQH